MSLKESRGDTNRATRSVVVSGDGSDDRMARRAALSGFFGSVIEYYDFLLYGTAAALVLGPLFFPSHSSIAGTLAALATFGIAYIARPVGAVIFGHFGDRIGRRRMLQISLLMMGGSSALIGLLPTYESIGVAAPALLVLCRTLQGLSAGGEQTGSSILTMEHASAGKRTLYASWTPNGSTIGSALATLVFIPVAALPEDALLSWGWRVPFLVSIVTVAIAMYLRKSVTESPEFARVTANAGDNSERTTTRPVETPLVTVFREQKRALLCVFVCAFLQSISSFVTVFGLYFATEDGAVGRTPMLVAIFLCQIVALVFIPMWAILSDRVGLKMIFVIGATLCAAGCAGFLAAIASGSVVLAVAATLLLKGVIWSAPYGIWPVFYGEQFTPEVRYTGTGVAMQSSLVLVGFVPAICVGLLGIGSGGWLPVAIFMGALCLAAAVAGALSREAPTSPKAYPDMGRMNG